MTSIVDFFEALNYSFIQRSLITAILLGIFCGIIGCFIILKRMVFLVDGIAHSAFAGGALSILLGFNPWIIIGGFGITTAILMGYVEEKGKIQNETAIGIVFAFTMGLAIIFRSMLPQYTNGIDALLFGSVATVSSEELIILIIIGSICLILIVLTKKELFFITFDEELARANGLPVRKLNYLFLIISALIVMVSIKIVGVILLLAVIVTPAACAYQFTYKFNKMILFSILISLICTFIGYMISFILEISTSASIVVILTLAFFISYLASPKRRTHRPSINEEFCITCQKLKSINVKCDFCEQEQILNREE
ncbi:MAG: metal ABC transporter permease [Promethearchaeota archaeon]